MSEKETPGFFAVPAWYGCLGCGYLATNDEHRDHLEVQYTEGERRPYVLVKCRTHDCRAKGQEQKIFFPKVPTC